MPKNTVSQTGSHNVTVKTNDSWAKEMADVQKEGRESAKKLKEQGNRFLVRILAPNEMQEGDSTPLSGVRIDLDWRVKKKQEMVETANELITNAYILGHLDPAFPTVLRSVINGEGLYAYSIGEFFQLYGQFEGKYGTRNKGTKDTMAEFVNGDQRFLKPYWGGNGWSDHPLPYAVRNYLAHSGHNPKNELDLEGNELRTSIELLRSWVN